MYFKISVASIAIIALFGTWLYFSQTKELPANMSNYTDWSTELHCDNGKRISAKFSKGVAAVQLSDGRNLTLYDAHIAVGERYSSADNLIDLWNGMQNDFYLQENGTTTYGNCQDPNVHIF